MDPYQRGRNEETHFRVLRHYYDARAIVLDYCTGSCGDKFVASWTQGVGSKLSNCWPIEFPIGSRCTLKSLTQTYSSILVE